MPLFNPSTGGSSAQATSQTAADWVSEDPVLLEGEFGFETDAGGMKVGDGSTAWTSLGYATPPVAMESVLFGVAHMNTIAGAPTKNELPGSVFDDKFVYRVNNSEGVVVQGRIPAHWRTGRAYVHWANVGTGSGNVQWELYYDELGVGDDMLSGTASSTSATVAASTTQEQLMVSQLTLNDLTFQNAVGQFFNGVLFRGAPSTLVGDALLFGLEIRRLT